MQKFLTLLVTNQPQCRYLNFLSLMMTLFSAPFALANGYQCNVPDLRSNFLIKFDSVRRHHCLLDENTYSGLKTINKKHESVQMSLYEQVTDKKDNQVNCLNGSAPGDEKCRKRFRSSRIDPYIVGSYGKYIDTFAAAFNIDPLLLHSIAFVESRYNPSAVSPKGARGIMQIMPATAERFGFTGSPNELFDPVINIKLSCAYLRSLYEMFGNDIPLVLAAYNAGENAVIKYGRQVPPYIETQDYVTKVVQHYLELRTY